MIGGGYAGMAAAVTLAKNGHRATVFESAKELGGRARRIVYRGETLDNGQHILSGAYRETLRLMREVGVAKRALLRRPLTLDIPPHFSLRAPRLPAPLHLAWALLTASGLTLSERYAAIKLMRMLKRQDFQRDGNETVAAFLSANNQPPKLVQYLWEPLTVSALNTPIARASAQVLANVLRDALASRSSASDLLLPATDLSTLFPDAAATWLETHGNRVLAGSRVKSVAALPSLAGGFAVESDSAGQQFDAVVMAIGPHQYEAIQLPAALKMPTFQYEPILTMYLKFSHPVRLAMPMLGQVGGLVQWFFDRRQLSTHQGAAGGLIAAVVSASGAHEDLANDELVSRVLAELAKQTGPLPPLEWHKVISEKFATFACTPAMQAQRPGTSTSIRGLVIAGDFVTCDYPATLEGAVRNGIRAADAIHRDALTLFTRPESRK